MIFKDKPRLFDRIRVFGGDKKATFRGMRMEDGSTVPVETIMKQFGVTKERAAQIAKRMAR
jgi:hypothetical protein